MGHSISRPGSSNFAHTRIGAAVRSVISCRASYKWPSCRPRDSGYPAAARAAHFDAVPGRLIDSASDSGSSREVELHILSRVCLVLDRNKENIMLQATYIMYTPWNK